VGRKDYYSHGNYNVICDLCGQKFKATELTMQWNYLFTCSTCYEPRNPQDFVKGIRDDMKVPIARPDATTPTFIVNEILPEDL
jgi:hypothetical protein